MPGKKLFEYAILRIVPRVEREEFVNAGVILYCKDERFLQMRYKLDEEKVFSLYRKADMDCIVEYLESFEKICNGDHTAGPIAQLKMPERFRWLTATRSTILQSSKVHPGLCDDASQMLLKIFNEQVG